jgi:peptidyl-prolyl cis-trans isomerase SurA
VHNWLHVKWRILAFLALAAAVLAASCKKEVAPGPNVWAVVNGHEIMRQDVDKVFRSRVNAEAPAPSNEEALSLKLSILDEMINSEILLERAKKMNLVASDAEVEEQFAESKSPYTEEQFHKKLTDSGLTADDLKSDIREQMSIQKLLNREVVDKITVTDQDVANFYNQHRSEFDVAEPQYHVAQIVITSRADPSVHNLKNSDATNDAEAGRKAAMLIRMLEAGADFSQLASEYSEDSSASTAGDLGFISESDLNQSDPALKRVVLALKPDQFSQPIRLRGGGYRILKLIAKEPAGNRQLSDPQVQQAVRNALRTRKEQLLRAAYLAEARDEAHVTNYLAREILESAGSLPAGK